MTPRADANAGQRAAVTKVAKAKKPSKAKAPLTAGELVSRAAQGAQLVLVNWATAAGIELGRLGESVIRLCVVHAVFRRFALLQGVFIVDRDEGHFGSWLPDDEAVRALFQSEIDAIDLRSDLSELLGLALEPLASKEETRGRGAHFTPRAMAGPIVAKALAPLLKLVEPARTLELRVCDPAVGGGVFLLELVSQLAERLLACGRCTDVYAARRLVAIHCAYGVDVDPVSVECTKLALWLECRAVGMPWNWLDGNIKTGDALVGLLDGQLRAFHFKLDQPAHPELAAMLDRAVQMGRDARVAQMAALSTFAEAK